jgi:hypothetical protein
MGVRQDTRTSRLNTTSFWHIIFPVCVIVVFLFILFVIFTLPDWALTCSSNLESVRRFTKTPGATA